MWFWLFSLSVVINIFLMFYIRWLLQSVKHIKSIYELEMFYGDETLKSLMDHGTQLSSQLEKIDFIINEEEELEDIATPTE